MNKELVISATDTTVDVALLEDKQLVELHKERIDNQYVVGDVYLGRVKKIMPGLNAIFVSLGGDKDGFMHYLDLGANYNNYERMLRLAMNGDASVATLKDFKREPILEKVGNITTTVKVGQYLLVQVTKEPISTKGPKLDGNISFAGRYIVLTPFSDKISVSQKIKKPEERSRLRRLVQSIKPANFGIIVRTIAEGRSVAEIDADLRNLMNAWATLCKKLKTATSEMRVYSELNTTTSLLRDMLSDEFNTIFIDNEQCYNDVKNYVATIAPDKVDIVRHYRMTTPIFEQFGIQRDIRRAFGRIVTIRSGVYLYIEHTEAMHVIDVNSGNHVKAGTGQEDTALQVNIESAKEIARQLRLRDMGGIVIVDFVDMEKAEHRKKLFEVMTEEMKRDKSRHTILPLSKFGLMQITRQRVRPAMEVDVQEKCPLCEGTGKIKSSLTIVDDIEADVRHLTTQKERKKLTIVMHPFVHSFLTRGLISVRMRWQWKYKARLQMISAESNGLLSYQIKGVENEVEES
ncbi:MAG: Rne/Rng family ribonuclease [Bacteroidales bacterium]|nr:Rne/Rng family ribonuclease [Bacteroidales bacterium]